MKSASKLLIGAVATIAEFGLATRLQIAKFAVGVATVGAAISGASAADLLVADRLTHNVYRYSESGELLNTVIANNSDINQAVGLMLSPDQTHLYVSSAQNNRVMRYDYDVATGTADNAHIFAEGSADNLAFPNSILFSADGNRIYVSNYAEPSVAQFNLDGSSAGPPLVGPIGFKPNPDFPEFSSTIGMFSGLAFHPDGRLLVGGWAGIPDASYGAIGVSDVSITEVTDFTGPVDDISGASGLLVHEGYLYVSGMLASQIRRFDLATGEMDPEYIVPGLPYPQALLATPDGSGFVVGLLGDEPGAGRLDRYLWDGTFVETVAEPGDDGFEEATAYLYVTTPAGLAGDYNGDGAVDAADYTVWRNNLGSSHNLSGNGNESGTSANVVDAADYQWWKTHYGQGGDGTGSLFTGGTTVPEPSMFVFSLVGFSGVAIMRRRRFQNWGLAPAADEISRHALASGSVQRLRNRSYSFAA